jgi:hypothetical protein
MDIESVATGLHIELVAMEGCRKKARDVELVATKIHTFSL